MTATLDDLIARLETATGPDRVLDLLIDDVVSGDDRSDVATVENLEAADEYGEGPARYTASIDAAATTALKGWRWAVGEQNVSQHGGQHYDGPYATCWHPTAGPNRSGIAFGCKGATPAIALTTAFLKARKTEAAA